jgi:hypothetical protein
MDTRIKSTSTGMAVSYNTLRGIERKDRKSAFQKFLDGSKSALSGASSAILPAIALSAPPTVGGAVLTAFVAGADKLTEGRSSNDLLEGKISGQSGLNGFTDRGMQYLMLQMEIQDEARRFTTLSNIIKARHDSAMSAIRNIRS